MRAVLTYHSVDDSGSAVSVPERLFREHVAWLGGGSVRVVGLPELLRLPDTEDAVAITFDDAVESFGRVAAPLLLDAGLPVTVYVVTGRAGADSAWPAAPPGPAVPVFRLLDRDELAELARAGVTPGAHTVTHPDLRALPDEILEEELAASKAWIEQELGCAPDSFAYPYGTCDERVVAAARRHFPLAVTAELGALPSAVDPHRIPRLDMVYFRDPRLLRAWGSPAFRAYLGTRRVLRRVGARVRRWS